MLSVIDTHLPSSKISRDSVLAVIRSAASLIATATPLAGSPSSPGATNYSQPNMAAVLCARRCEPSSYA
eukprot:scaffold284026_cov38-Tisochrysis_lutea.AAC.4